MAVAYEDICRPCCPVRYPIVDCPTGPLALFSKPVLSPISLLFLIQESYLVRVICMYIRWIVFALLPYLWVGPRFLSYLLQYYLTELYCDFCPHLQSSYSFSFRELIVSIQKVRIPHMWCRSKYMEVRSLEVDSWKIMRKKKDVRQVSPSVTTYTSIHSAWGF